jgi:DNA-binding CsgD family transcriptional regulator
VQPSGLEGARSDADLLRHILGNLLSNAVKYSEPDSPVLLTLERSCDDIVIFARDHGIGIPEEDRAHLFTSFARGSNVGQRPGSGLGLLIVHRCVELHCGRIQIESAVGLGADDYLTKPVSASDLLAAVAARLSREQSRSPASFNPDFTSSKPLEKLGLTPREAEVLLWVAQGKSNSEISTILGVAENTVKKHLQAVFEKLEVDNRNAAAMQAVEALG